MWLDLQLSRSLEEGPIAELVRLCGHRRELQSKREGQLEQAALLASTLEQLEAAKTTAREAEEKVQQADAQRDQALADLRTAQEVREPQSSHTNGMQRADVLPVSMQALSSVRSVDEVSAHELVEATQRCKALEEKVRRCNQLPTWDRSEADNFSDSRVD
jgi:hypothetical protein